jgi:hypothetical protein
MVIRFIYDRFDIRADKVDVRRHDPEDFIVRFRHRTDRDRVLASRPGVLCFRWSGVHGGGRHWHLRATSVFGSWWG